MFIKKVVVVGCLFLTACAPAMSRKPIIYGEVAGRDKDYDVFDCERWANTATAADPTIGQGAAEGMVGGAVMGTLLGLLIGGATGLPLGASAGYGAGFGGVMGGAQGASANADELERRKKQAVIQCLTAKGYENAAY